MKVNVGGIDRMVRLMAGVSLIVVAVLGLFPEPWSYVSIGVGVVLTMTALIRFCPLYPVLGISTCGD